MCFNGLYRNFTFTFTITITIGCEELAVRVEFVSWDQWLNLASISACSQAFIRYWLLSRRWWIVPHCGQYSCRPQRYKPSIVRSYFVCTKWFIRIKKWKGSKFSEVQDPGMCCVIDHSTHHSPESLNLLKCHCENLRSHKKRGCFVRILRGNFYHPEVSVYDTGCPG